MQNRRWPGSMQGIVGVLFTVGGAAALLVAPLRDKSAFVMSPGLEGCLTAGVVGLALALAGGAGYLATALLALPILLVQLLACQGSGEPALATLGIEALMLGILGFVMTPRPAPVGEAPARKRAATAPPARSSMPVKEGRRFYAEGASSA
ncbi:MAG TPA: hypothetical protein VE093_15270 [Polyangiaceae bacterium]|nr:hypothetical protein [Polyangiaceae bacterium]